MLFSDHFFLIYFLPFSLSLYLCAYYFSKSLTFANSILVILSLLFYISFGVSQIYILLIPLIFDFLLAILIEKLPKGNVRTGFFILGLLCNISMLAFYKYLGFFLMEIASPFVSGTIQRFLTTPTIFPVGLSFIIFQRISYLTDTYTKKISPTKNFLHYLVYAILFPHLIAGPIVRFYDIQSEVKKRIIDQNTFFEGIKLFSIGLFLKVFVADQLFLVEEHILAKLIDIDSFRAGIFIFSYSLRLYFDFLGYSLMAMGLAAFFGFHFPENFNSPYSATSVSDFWRKWNITLSNWIRDYVYIPLGGSRTSLWRTCVNVVLSMSIAGIWHGAGINFIIWGFFHGLLMAIERISKKYFVISIPIRIRQLLTFLVISLLWTVFRFSSVQEVMMIFSELISYTFFPLDSQTHNILMTSLPAWIVGIFWIVSVKERNISKITLTHPKLFLFTLLLIFTVVFSLTKRSITFIYFQF